MELVNTAALAVAFGVSSPAITGAVKAGRLSYQDAERKLFDLSVAKIQWAANRRRQRTPTQRMPTATSDDQTALVRARLRREQADASAAEMKLQERAGLLCRVDDVKRANHEVGRSIRDALLALPARIAQPLAAENDATKIYDLLDGEIRRVLTRLAKMEIPDPAEDGDESR